jgi:signal transduction histidine kinase
MAVAWGWLRARRTRAQIASLVVELARSPQPGGLQTSLGQSLGDPSLQIAYPIADGSRYVDATGRPVAIGNRGTPLVRAGKEVARLVHRPGLLDNPSLLEEVQAAARLALDNEQLHAETRAQLDDLQGSRARIVADGDAARRRLERDLHDGAQQRLATLSLSLRLGRSRLAANLDPAVLARLDQAEAELHAALEDLRTLAHGIFPAVLSDEGLAAAIEALAEETATPIRITSLPEQRLNTAAESAAYFVVSEAVKRSGAGSVTIGAARHDDLLVIEVESPGPPVEVVDLEDRIGALGGSLELARTANTGVTIRAEIPCES